MTDQDEAADPTYAYKPKLIGAIAQLTLRRDAIEWELGGRSGRLRYDRVRAVRVSYRPVTMQSQRFVTEIWGDGNPKIQIVSVSWRSLAEQQRQDAPYVAFVTELHRRIAAADATVQFTAGLPFLLFWAGVVIVGLALAAALLMFARTTTFDQWQGNAFIAALFAILTYQFVRFFHRNRPLRYGADAIPPGAMPRV